MKLKTIIMHSLLMVFALTLLLGGYGQFLFNFLGLPEPDLSKFVTHYTLEFPDLPLDSSPPLDASPPLYSAPSLDSSPPLYSSPPLDASPRLKYSRLHCARFETGGNAGSCHCYSRQGMRLDVPADVCNSRVGEARTDSAKQEENLKIMMRLK